MHFKCRNVNDAFTTLVQGITDGSISTTKKTSRVGNVLQIEEPVIITYSHPKEKVLFNQKRDANCFFHMFESIWMLAGRNDVKPLLTYNSKIGEIASDDGGVFNGAYGFRWRNARVGYETHESFFGEYADERFVDQLEILIDHLKNNPTSRRAVLQMWGAEDDLLNIGHYIACPHCNNGKWENGSGKAMLAKGANCPYCKGAAKLLIDCSKDVCCNTNIYFSIRTKSYQQDSGGFTPAGQPISLGTEEIKFLDMTVCNRSNDLVWGCMGANVVHFAFLLEYMAACIGAEVGVYNQFTNNLHCYVDRPDWQPKKWLEDKTPYKQDSFPSWGFSLVKDPKQFDLECKAFVNSWKGVWKEPFFARVAAPMCRAFALHKERKYDQALATIDQVEAYGWKFAGHNWLLKRKQNWEDKSE
jgi:thymidylate synthase